MNMDQKKLEMIDQWFSQKEKEDLQDILPEHILAECMIKLKEFRLYYSVVSEKLAERKRNNGTKDEKITESILSQPNQEPSLLQDPLDYIDYVLGEVTENEREFINRQIEGLLVYGSGFHDERIVEKIKFDNRFFPFFELRMDHIQLLSYVERYRTEFGIPDMRIDSEAYQKWRENRKEEINQARLAKLKTIDDHEIKRMMIKKAIGTHAKKIIEQGDFKKSVQHLKRDLGTSCYGCTFGDFYGFLTCNTKGVSVDLNDGRKIAMSYEELIGLYELDHLNNNQGRDEQYESAC